MHRAVKVTLQFATAAKRRRINALLQAYRTAVNFYIGLIWREQGGLNRETRIKLQKTRLPANYKGCALRQAFLVVITTKMAAKATKKPCSMPVFKGPAVLSRDFAAIEDGKGSFDLIVRLTCLNRGNRIVVPTKKTAVFNKWMGKPGARLIQSATLSEDSLTIWIEVPDLPPKQGESLGVDIGINKLLSDSNGQHYGTEFRALRDKINRAQLKSKGKHRALRHRDNFIRQQVNRLPWNRLGLLAIEQLKNLKRGKRRNRGKTFRKAMIPWTYHQVIEVLRNKAQENRVHLVAVEPAYTSQTCPACGTVSQNNRSAEVFKCIDCDYSQDADTVGALNILSKALQLVGSVKSPTPVKAVA
jgi:IS605 OrfB family transposase